MYLLYTVLYPTRDAPFLTYFCQRRHEDPQRDDEGQLHPLELHVEHLVTLVAAVPPAVPALPSAAASAAAVAIVTTAAVVLSSAAAMLPVPTGAAAARGGDGESDHEEDQQDDGVRGPEQRDSFSHEAVRLQSST